MDTSSFNKSHFHFVCTNLGSSKDGIGHYTSKVIEEINRRSALKVFEYSGKTDHYSKLQLFLSLKMSVNLWKLKKSLDKNLHTNFIFIEYPFVEYNPLILLILYLIHIRKSQTDKIVISLHEYQRTKFLRKFFIRRIISVCDVVLYTRFDDIRTFLEQDAIFIKRTIPPNITPSSRKSTKLNNAVKFCFFGLINYETKEIKSMLNGWECFYQNQITKDVEFHFISSSFDALIKENKNIIYHYGLEDKEVSKLLHGMQFMILPLKPKISLNNGSLLVSCAHECVPVGVFDPQNFRKDFGIGMNNYSVEEFIRIYEKLYTFSPDKYIQKSQSVYNYSKTRSIENCVQSYLSIIN